MHLTQEDAADLELPQQAANGTGERPSSHLLNTQQGSSSQSASVRLADRRQGFINKLAEYPAQAKYIFANEACERYSFYGMRSILTIFLTEHLHVADHDAETVFHAFVAGCYVLPLAGAHLSDHYLGKYRTILYLSYMYCVGHAILAAWETLPGTYCGLLAIAMGAGGIKPAVSAFIGDQFPPEKQHLLSGAFAIFYWMINMGSLLASLTTPLLLAHAGPRLAFAMPGIGMAMATLVFWSGRRLYINMPPKAASSKPGTLRIAAFACSRWRPLRHKGALWDSARERFPTREVEEAAALLRLLPVFGAVAFFWALYDQHSSTWVLQARDMDLRLGAVHIQPSQIQALNPLLVMILIPCMQHVVYPLLRALGVAVTPLRCMTVGMFLAAASFAVVACIQMLLDAGHRLSVLWQGTAHVILVVAELLVSVTGLEFAYSRAPPGMKATVMSLLLLATFAGNLLDALIVQLNVLDGAALFWFFAALMFAVAALFCWIAAHYQEQTFSEDKDEIGLVGVKSHASDEDLAMDEQQRWPN